MVKPSGENLRVDLGIDLRADFCVGGAGAVFWAGSPWAEPRIGERNDFAGNDSVWRSRRRLLPDAVEDNDTQVGPAAAGEIDREDGHALKHKAGRAVGERHGVEIQAGLSRFETAGRNRTFILGSGSASQPDIGSADRRWMNGVVRYFAGWHRSAIRKLASSRIISFQLFIK